MNQEKADDLDCFKIKHSLESIQKYDALTALHSERAAAARKALAAAVENDQALHHALAKKYDLALNGSEGINPDTGVIQRAPRAPEARAEASKEAKP